MGRTPNHLTGGTGGGGVSFKDRILPGIAAQEGLACEVTIMKSQP